MKFIDLFAGCGGMSKGFKLTDYQAKKILDEMGEEKIKDLVLVPIHGMIVDNIGREE